MIVGTRDGLLGGKRRRSERKGSLKWVDLLLILRYVQSMWTRDMCYSQCYVVTASHSCMCIMYSLHLRGSIRSGPEAVTLNIVLSDWMLVTSPGAQRVRRSQQVGPCVSVPPCIAAVTRKTRLLDVVYNASNNELVRTKTLVKNCIVQIDATPFRQW